jgi:hypothetical protein
MQVPPLRCASVGMTIVLNWIDLDAGPSTALRFGRDDNREGFASVGMTILKAIPSLPCCSDTLEAIDQS